MAIRKHRLVFVFALVSSLAGALIFMGRAQADTLGFSVGSSSQEEPGDIRVTVLDDRTFEPISDARISVTDFFGSFEAESFSDGRGQRDFWMGSTFAPRRLLVTKPGYASVSLHGITSPEVTVYLKVIPEAAPDTIVSGRMGSWDMSAGRRYVYAGLAFRSISALDLLHFDLDAFISPLRDTIDIAGPRRVPSNFVAPFQRITVFFTTVTLDKQDYRLPLRPDQATRLVGVEGQILVDDMIALANGSMTVDLLNKLKFTRAGISNRFFPGLRDRIGIDTFTSLSTEHTVTPSAPPFAGDVIVAAVTDLDGDRVTMMPTDIKAAATQQAPQVHSVDLAAAPASAGRARHVVTVANADRGRRLSGILTPQAGRNVNPGEYLPLPEMPASLNRLTVQAPRNGVATAVLEAPVGEKSYPLAYVYALPAAGTVTVPVNTLPDSGRIRSYSVMQLDFGSTFNEKAIDGKTAMQGIRRFSRATAETQ